MYNKSGKDERQADNNGNVAVQEDHLPLSSSALKTYMFPFLRTTKCLFDGSVKSSSLSGLRCKPVTSFSHIVEDNIKHIIKPLNTDILYIL